MLSPTTGGVLLEVRVIPRSGKPGLAGTRGGALLVRLNAPPVEGAANAELIDVLSATLGVPKRAVTIVAGGGARQKRVRIDGLSADAARRLLGASGGFPDRAATKR